MSAEQLSEERAGVSNSRAETKFALGSLWGMYEGDSKE